MRVSSEGHAQPVSQWWWRWSDVDRRVGCKWVVPGPGPDSYDRQQWLQTAREQYECRKRCRTATRSVSQADVANGLANRSGRAVYLSETRSDVRSTGARSRLREWLGRAALVKMCSRPEENTNTEWVGASAWPRRGYLRKTDKTNNKRVYQFNCNCQEAAVKGSVYAAARSRLLLGRRASEARRFARKTIIGLVMGGIGDHGLPTPLSHRPT